MLEADAVDWYIIIIVLCVLVGLMSLYKDEVSRSHTTHQGSICSGNRIRSTR
jgi:hypothetical protein